MYEVHISHELGVIEHPSTVVVPVDARSWGIASSAGSIFVRTPDRRIAEHVVEVQEATARRSDDRHAWIREVAA